MSRPIDIPGRPAGSGHLKPIREDNSFPSEDGPYFGYIEISESENVDWAVSSGFDQYVRVSPKRSLPCLAFIVEKDLQARKITIEVTSLELRQCLYRAILNRTPSSVPVELDFETLLQYYDALKLQLGRLESRSPHDDATAELRLLVHDLLLDRALYEGVGLEQYREVAVLSSAHVEDIHQRNVDIGLDDIEDCFVLGLTPDTLNEEYVDALNSKYAAAARIGDLAGLRNICEPVVRSGEITFQYNPCLLLEVLDNGHLDAYLYILDLVDRTREDGTASLDADDCDVTYHPFYIAIRLGQLDAVRMFVREKATFEGRISGGQEVSGDGGIFTPLVAAVFWRQPKIVRTLLRSSPIYLSGYQQAVALALSSTSEDIITVFTEHEQKATPDTVLGTPSLINHQRSWRATAYPRFLGRSTFGDDMQLSRSVSEITNGLASLHPEPVFEQQSSAISQGFGIINPQLLLDTSHHVDSADMMEVRMETPSDGPVKEGIQEREPSQAEGVEQLQQYIRQRSLHHNRRKLGRNLVLLIDKRCAKLQEFCLELPHLDCHRTMMNEFESMEQVWESGVEGFRKITRNEVPSSLVEVLQCLLVADALCHQIAPDDDRLRYQFIGDLGRWKTLIDDSDQVAFDQVVHRIWGTEEVSPLPGPDMGTDELYHFQDLIQNLVFLQKAHERSPRKQRHLGRRLRSLRRQLRERQNASPFGTARKEPLLPTGDGFQSIGDVLGKLTKDTDSIDEDDIDLGDFVHLEELQEDASSSQPQSRPGPLSRIPWKELKPMVVFLLASVAFSVVLVMISAIQDGFHGDLLRALHGGHSGYSRSCAIAACFLDLDSPKSGLGGTGTRPTAAKGGKRSPLIAAMKGASQREPKSTPLSSSLATSVGSYNSTLRASMSSPSASSFFSTDFSSDGGPRKSDRLRCLSFKCPKTFSSVSNRNKHMREGCAFRDKKGGGYQCRNGSCTKVLTTKWYRNTHEQTRCRFR